MKINISNILILILIDILGFNKLWNERTDRRVFHNLINSNYNPDKVPYLEQFPKLLNVYENEKNIIINNKKFNFDNINGNGINTYSKILSSLTGGLYSKRSTIYFNDFPINDVKSLMKIGNHIKNVIEKKEKKKLYFGDSDFKIVLLRYEGESASFSWHYDTESSNCYRTLTLIKKNSTIPYFYYIDINKNIKMLNFELGDTIFFRGTQTYHMVENSNDKNTIRWMLGYQFCESEFKIDHKSLCSEFRGASIFTIIRTFIPLILPVIILMKINIIKIYYQDIKNYILINLLILIYKLLKTNLDLKTYIIYYFYTLVYFDPISSFGYISYILLTE